MSRTAHAPASSVMSARTTRAPSPANSRAAIFPMPLAAPVISATLPSSLATLLRLPDRGIEEGGRLGALQGGDQVLGGEHAHGDPRVHRGAPEVRDDHDVLELQQGRVHLRLLLEHVEAGSEDHAL